MARIAFELKEFRQDYRRAAPAIQKRIEAFLDKFEKDTSSGGLRLKMLKHRVDRRIRTARVDDGTRAVLADLGSDEYVLLRVLPHDAAIAYAQAARLDVSALNGLPRLIDLHSAPPAVPPDPKVRMERPLDHRSDDDLVAVGIPQSTLPAFRSYPTVEPLLEFAALLGKSDPLIEFAVELLLDHAETVDDVLESLLTLDGAATPEEIAADPVAAIEPAARPREAFDVDDVVAALERPGAGERFRIVEDSEELLEALRGEFADWQVFLHPLQRRAAYETSFSGAARVSGGAGTGKTVVLLHRVAALLDRADHDEPPRILVTTFTDHLKRDLRRLLTRLVGKERADDVDVRTVDGLAHDLHAQLRGTDAVRLTPKDELALWSELATASRSERSTTFLRNEHRHVLLARGIRTLEDYLEASRTGRGVRLGRDERRALWPVFEAFEARTRGAGTASTLQQTEDVAALLAANPIDLYDHVLVDEAQDLHASQWRLLRAIVPEGPDDLFIAGDAFQRIYGDTVSLRSVGIETRGRSVRLRRNYRSTHEIIGWGLGVIGRETALDIDEHGADLAGYHSVRSGPEPVTLGAADRDEELALVGSLVDDWVQDGYATDEIAVVTRTDADVEALVGAIAAVDRPAGPLGAKGRLEGKVNVGTMHRVKGLEYSCVVVTGLGANALPPPGSVCPPDVDLAQHHTDLRTERSLVYVAATRARDHLALTWVGPRSPLASGLPADAGSPQPRTIKNS